VLWTFTGNDGANPLAGVIADDDGVLYGTTDFGGTNSSCQNAGFGCGVVFKLTGTGFAPKDED
jgi:hypothetical protein